MNRSRGQVYEERRPDPITGKLTGQGEYYVRFEAPVGTRANATRRSSSVARKPRWFATGSPGRPPTDPSMLSERQREAADTYQAQAALFHHRPDMGDSPRGRRTRWRANGRWFKAKTKKTSRGINRTAENQRNEIVRWFGPNNPVVGTQETLVK